MESSKMINNHYLEITEYLGEGYQPCVDYGEWRVAILRYIAELEAEKITYFERHNETDEVFVLLAGRCILLIGEGEENIDRIQAVEMVPHKLYNIKKAAFHNHILSDDAVVLIVENRDTGAENSDRIPLSAEQQEQVIQLARSSWGKKR
jgi:hypothetical protein